MNKIYLSFDFRLNDCEINLTSLPYIFINHLYIHALYMTVLILMILFMWILVDSIIGQSNIILFT